jgi:N6-adenosine-specific RNA methylase IME4
MVEGVKGKEIQLAPVHGTLTATSWTPPANMTSEQWKLCAKQFAQMHGASAWWLGDVWASGQDREWGAGQEFADEIGVDYGALRTYAWVCRNLSVRIDNLSFGHHQLVASFGPDKQKEWLERAAKEQWTIREMKSALIKVRRRERHADIAQANAFSFEKRFPLIYADPPWEFKVYSELSNQTPANHYPTMSVDEICDLMVGDKHILEIIADNCALFLWCTSSNLVSLALPVLQHWGFEYVTHAVWDKQKTGTGYIFRNQHEVLIYAKRGDIPLPAFVPSSVFSYPRGKHSAKPPEVRQALEKMYPAFGKQDRIELFARGKIPGWTIWGNEAVQDDERTSIFETNVAPIEPTLEENVKRLFLAQAQKTQKARRTTRALKCRSQQR